MQRWAAKNYINVCSSFYGQDVKPAQENDSEEPGQSSVKERTFVISSPKVY